MTEEFINTRDEGKQHDRGKRKEQRKEKKEKNKGNEALHQSLHSPSAIPTIFK